MAEWEIGMGPQDWGLGDLGTFALRRNRNLYLTLISLLMSLSLSLYIYIYIYNIIYIFLSLSISLSLSQSYSSRVTAISTYLHATWGPVPNRFVRVVKFDCISAVISDRFHPFRGVQDW